MAGPAGDSHERYGTVRDFKSSLAYATATLHTNGAAYADVVSVYAALGWDGLREAARVLVSLTSGRG